ncbi:hypothetical protein C0993_012727 [Termitomyces sp. T159_Od127]|nr:hypothetical protein C0993_012727 [Termitomyces sp. T159_Od127]
MGRALFSTMYAAPPAAPPHADRPATWSAANPFDPDSDEFYEGATREVFTDTDAWRQEQEAVRELLSVQARASADSPSSDASDSDAGSPMAVGADDPAQLFADAFHPADWTPWVARISASSPAEPTSAASPPASPTFRRTVPITPIPLPDAPAEPSPSAPVLAHALSPHSWGRPDHAGPLTNPAARLSYVMLNTTPVRVRVQNSAV